MRKVFWLGAAIALALVLLIACGSAPTTFEAAPRIAPGTVACAPTGGATLGATAGGAKDVGWARDVIARGGIPDAASITVEGLFSESDLPLEGTTPHDVLSLDLGTGVAEGAYLVQIGMSSNLAPETWRRAPLNLCAVVDVSGSMDQAGKIGAVKRALRALVARLDERDMFSIVAFNESAWVAAPVRAVDGRRLASIIDGLTAGGSTNMHAGLDLGFRQVAEVGRGGQGGRNPRVILFTDALPNAGMFSDDGFVRLATTYGREGIGLTAFGVGLDFGHDLARKISECPGGNYRFLRDAGEIAGVFDKDFDFLVTPIAYELEVVVTAAPGYEIAETFGFPGGGFKVATVFLSRSKGALALRLRRTDAAAGRRLCDVALSYRTEATGAMVCQFHTAVLPAALAPDAEHFSHAGVRKTLDLAMLAVAMQDACAQPSSAKARERLAHAQARLERDSIAMKDADLAREAQLAARLLANLRSRPTGT